MGGARRESFVTHHTFCNELVYENTRVPPIDANVYGGADNKTLTLTSTPMAAHNSPSEYSHIIIKPAPSQRRHPATSSALAVEATPGWAAPPNSITSWHRPPRAPPCSDRRCT
uniref:BIRD-IDD transcription factor fourth C2HC zinc finger domain-containing protein n=1 Tax=Leersia perrieri TaxID=77586 RepID=A0A0D9XGL5_9ORYZ